MSARRVIPLLALAAMIAIVALPLPALGQSGIIVDNADSMRQQGVSLDAGLSAATTSVGPRIVSQYANAGRQAALVAPAGELSAILGQVVPRVVVDYANAGRQMALLYPQALLAEAIPPQITSVGAQGTVGGVKVTWTTDEFATSEVRFGTAPGAYTQVVSDPLYGKQHEVRLPGLAQGTTYYYVVLSTDRSGNQALSSQYQVKAMAPTYLPLVLRR